jgi:integrase
MAKRGKQRSNGEGGLILRGRIYWAQYYDSNHKQIRVSTRTHVKQEAQAYVRQLMNSRDKGETPVSDLRKVKYETLRQGLLDSYVSHKSLIQKPDGEQSIPGLSALDDFCKGMSAVQLTTDLAARFVRKRQAEKVGSAAINRSLACLRRMFVIGARSTPKKVNSVPWIQFLREPHARNGFLERRDFYRLIKLIPTHLKPFITFLYWCGCRCGETLQITWSQVNLDAKHIRLESIQTKNSQGRVVPLSSELVDMLRQLPREGTIFDGTNLRKEWITACCSAGLGTLSKVEGRKRMKYKGLTLHDLRRSAARNMRNAGVSEKEIMEIGGWKTRSVFERYNIVSSEDVMNAMRKLELSAMNDAQPVLTASSGVRSGVQSLQKAHV